MVILPEPPGRPGGTIVSSGRVLQVQHIKFGLAHGGLGREKAKTPASRLRSQGYR